MKKLIIALIALVLLCSCKKPGTQTKIYTTDGKPLYVRKFEYDGHRYIEFFRMLEVYDNYTGYVHDPDCPCHKEQIRVDTN